MLVIDEFLDPPFSDEELDRIDQMRDRTGPGRYNWVLKEGIGDISGDLHRFYKRTVEVLELDEDQVIGIEFWINRFGPGDGIHMHSDIDEMLYRKTRLMRCAMAGTMCFGRTPGLKGGSFVFEDGITIRPRDNRAVLFFGGTRHGVEPVVEGERVAALMAVWDRIPTAHQT
jgi:hypothetical protein